MSDFTTVAKVGAIPEGQGQAFAVNGRMVAVFNENGSYYAIDDFCPHMGASLAGGILEDGVVACPWHLWRFSIKNGSWEDSPSTCIDAFEIRVEGDEIQVLVPDKAPPKATGGSCDATEAKSDATKPEATEPEATDPDKPES